MIPILAGIWLACGFIVLIEAHKEGSTLFPTPDILVVTVVIIIVLTLGPIGLYLRKRQD